MRALFLTHNLPERGSYFRAWEIARRLAARGHEVDFGHISEHKKYRPHIHELPCERGQLRRIEFPNRTIINERQEGWGIFDLGWRCARVLRHKYDLVYAFSHKPDCLMPALISRVHGTALVLDWSDWWSGPEGLYQFCVLGSAPFRSLPRPIRWARRAVFAVEQVIEPRAWRLADCLTLISHEFLSHPLVERHALWEKSIVLHSGAPLDAIVPQPKGEARQRIGLELPPEAIVLGYVANFHTDEQLLLEAFARALQRHQELYLLVVGSDFESLTPELHEQTRGRIHHMGRRPFNQIGDYLAAADVLLLPLTNIALNRARYPHKLSDYVAAGRPIVACDVGETGRLLKRYQIGMLTEPTARGFAHGIQNMLSARSQWEQMGKDVRRAAEEHFNWDHLCQRLFGFLETRLPLSF
ncbi:MAG: glycosyltransferase family 4 protein [Candidatus Sumerlaea chitinivorans]|nr:glycosyltransferase family 4 protein [Candidatus Sumerlaea chitinivorans]